METVLLENMGLLANETEKWVKKIDANYVMINPEVRNYMRSDDLHTFAMLINPTLKNIVTSSAFVTIMGFSACEQNGKVGREGSHCRDYEKQDWMQLEYMTWLIYQAVGFRHKNKIQPINIYVNYLGENFLKDVNADKLGPDVKTYLMLMLRHWEGSITLHIYKNHKKTKTIINEDQLKFD